MIKQHHHYGRYGKMIAVPVLLLLLSGIFIACGNMGDKPSTGDRPVVKAANQSSKTDKARTYKIVIDAGHGGVDPGAEGASGKEEKAYTLSLSLRIYDLLKREPLFEPYLTRNVDTFVTLEDRAKFANELDADALISIHGNTYTDPDVSGTETYYYTDSSKRLAETLHGQLLKALGFRDREVRKYPWKVISLSEMPAVLAEIGYMTNPDEEAAMLGKDGQVRAAQAVVDGLKQYFAEANKGERKG